MSFTPSQTLKSASLTRRTFVLSATATAALGLGGRIYTLPGSHASHRYVWTIGKGHSPSPDDEFCLIIREGGASRYRINGVKCFVR